MHGLRESCGIAAPPQLTNSKCDASAATDVAGLADALHSSGVRIGAIMHAAGVLRDALLSNQTAANLRATLAAKSGAARCLAHHLAAMAPVGALTLFSSIAGLLGGAGQASYAVANAALDGLASGWQEQGVAATSIAWGAWGGVGMAAADAGVSARMHRLGIATSAPTAGLAALHEAVTLSMAVGSSTVLAAALVWERLLVDGRQRQPFYAEFAGVTAAAGQHQQGSSGADAVVTVTSSQRSGRNKRGAQPAVASSSYPAWQVLSLKKRAALFTEKVSAIVAHMLGHAVGPAQPLISAGLDSLGAVEVQRQVAALAGLDLPSTLVFDYPSVAEIAEYIAGLLPPPERSRKSSLAALQQGQLVAAGSNNGGSVRVRAVAAKVMGGVAVAASTPLMTAGLDSLGAVDLSKELSKWVAGVFGVDVPSTLVFDYPTIDDLAEELAGRSSVDLLGADFDAAISIERGRISLFPAVPPSVGGDGMPARSLPPSGSGLNQPAMLTFRRMAVKQPGDARVVAAFKRKLEEAAGHMGAIFVHYDPREGVWLIKLDACQ
ncbi:polyketide synthase [Micractinium conductrix]|uniref:Polyketide synthase n=1 Tax=Micractinium conductrix TaxID=554055 RepID=A0A2P6V168_9CHLO|nr:polyketide synthase [Micractinium conductrix]|eukprot:PSC67784.1 polyketide synthase [Micractinium conductrix]